MSSSAMAEWVKLIEREAGMVYYDPDRIIRLPSSKVSVWIKYSYSKEEIDRMPKKANINFKNYSHSIIKQIFDCTLKQEMTSSVHMYSSDNKTLFSQDLKSSEKLYRDVVPGTGSEALMKLACEK